MTTQETSQSNVDYIVIAYNNLSYNCQTLVGDEYWNHYQLGHQENGAGCLYSELDDWEECEANDEEIVVSTPGLRIPEWCGECEIVWQLLKKETNDGTDYFEVGLIPESDKPSLNAWYKWYDSGFSDEQPEGD